MYRAPWTEGVAGEDHLNREGQHQGMDGPVDVIILRIAEDRRRWTAVAAEASVRVLQQRLSGTDFD